MAPPSTCDRSYQAFAALRMPTENLLLSEKDEDGFYLALPQETQLPTVRNPFNQKCQCFDVMLLACNASALTLSDGPC